MYNNFEDSKTTGERFLLVVQDRYNTKFEHVFSEYLIDDNYYFIDDNFLKPYDYFSNCTLIDDNVRKNDTNDWIFISHFINYTQKRLNLLPDLYDIVFDYIINDYSILYRQKVKYTITNLKKNETLVNKVLKYDPNVY